MERFSFENDKESKKQKYHKEVSEYFLERKNIQELQDSVEKLLEVFILDENKILEQYQEPIIFISNHPRISEELKIPANGIESKKGGNKFGFDTFNFPIVRQILIKKTLKRPFKTISLDNGWEEAMMDLDHILISRGGEKRIEEIVKAYQPGDSVVIFPEGKSTGDKTMLPFRRGFIYLAQQIKLRKVVLAATSPMTTLTKKNEVRVLEILDIPTEESEMEDFLGYVQAKILGELETFDDE